MREAEVDRTYFVPILNNALCILRLLQKENRPMSIREISKITGYAETSVYRILRTLCAHDFLPERCKKAYMFSKGVNRKLKASRVALEA